MPQSDGPKGIVVANAAASNGRYAPVGSDACDIALARYRSARVPNPQRHEGRA
jgi:hypothetical protein